MSSQGAALAGKFVELFQIAWRGLRKPLEKQDGSRTSRASHLPGPNWQLGFGEMSLGASSSHIGQPGFRSGFTWSNRTLGVLNSILNKLLSFSCS